MFACVVVPVAAEAADRPNIVLVLADDLGWTDLQCMGSKYYETPNLDRLAAEGIRFTSAYTCGPNCAPTRACLMSGQYTPRHGVYTVGSGARGRDEHRELVPVDNRRELPLDVVTLAESLQDAGYATGMFGKWHLGNGDSHHPLQRGFDEAIVTGGNHFAPGFRTTPRVNVPEGTYLTDFLTDRAVKFIHEHRSEPFFLYVAHFAVHTPIQAKEVDVARYRDKPAAGGHHDPVYAGMIHALDESVGRIVGALEETGTSDNTLCIFYSDNGGHGGYGNLGGSTGRNITDNDPLRGGKGMLYEGGVRVPLLARWPEVIPPGSECHAPCITVDFYPTLVELAGAETPDQPLDGVSLVETLRSGGRTAPSRDSLYWHFPGYLQADEPEGTWRTTPAGSIRRGPWKLIEFFETGEFELYHLESDLGEQRDLSEAHPDRTRSMADQLRAWREDVRAPMPTRKTDTDR